MILSTLITPQPPIGYIDSFYRLLARISLLSAFLVLFFHYQYLHNPGIHIFFQAKGIFLF